MFGRRDGCWSCSVALEVGLVAEGDDAAALLEWRGPRGGFGEGEGGEAGAAEDDEGEDAHAERVVVEAETRAASSRVGVGATRRSSSPSTPSRLHLLHGRLHAHGTSPSSPSSHLDRPHRAALSRPRRLVVPARRRLSRLRARCEPACPVPTSSPRPSCSLARPAGLDLLLVRCHRPARPLVPLDPDHRCALSLSFRSVMRQS